MVKEENQKFSLCVKAALEKKAFDLIILDIKEVSSFADYFIICSGNSNRQVQAIASSIEHDLKKKGIYPLGIEGFNEGKWILLDYDEIIIHVFYNPIREFYELERLWADAPRIEIEDESRKKTKERSSSNNR
ncbi:MAG: ribosome-associated protein IOJAP [Deltaproteobacteria bacterium DG_8]|nr:MAG: ribosome-associated protein IOJAP [Deltaproteobacteria bacterium DG_8]